jgi:hypothetical protein
MIRELMADDEIFDAGEVGSEPIRIKPGDYDARLSDLVKAREDDGSPVWVWQFTVTNDSDAGLCILDLKTRISPGSMWRIHQLCVILGLTGDGKNARFTHSQAVGRMCRITVFDEEIGDGIIRSAIGEVIACRAQKSDDDS